jgi:methionyl-tRNA formyltransferase
VLVYDEFMNKIAFLGSGKFASEVFSRLLDAEDIDISLVCSNPDKKVGRKQVLTPTPLKALALEHNYKVETPNGSDELFELLSNDQYDFVVVCDYGMILPSKVLEVAMKDTLNVHPSLLPKYRGASPMKCALLNGDDETGVCIIKVVDELDAGDIYASVKYQIPHIMRYNELLSTLGVIGGDLLKEVILDFDKLGCIEQIGEPIHCGKFRKEDGLVDFNILSADEVYNKFRAFYEWPGTYFVHNEKRFKLIEIEVSDLEVKPGHFKEDIDLYIGCDEGTIRVMEFQPESKGAMQVSDFLRGNSGFFEG